jgi:N-acetylmuramate 1-kinase
LLDFQDAVEGPVSYDFISLVEDARRDVDDGVRVAMRDRYLAAFPGLDVEAFDLSCVILGAQRHCKVLGIFTRLRDRDGKDDYLHHLPRLWRLLERAAAHPSLAPLKTWLDSQIPAEMRIVPPARAGV